MSLQDHLMKPNEEKAEFSDIGGEHMSLEFKCPSCGKKLFSYEARTRKYGKMTGVCKKCNATYIDPRYKELAIIGIPEDEFSVLSYVLLILLGGFFFWRASHLFAVKQLGTPDSMQWLMPSVFALIGAALVIGGIAEIIMIKTGLKEKKMNKLLAESEQRMKDRTYVKMLLDMGVPVPEKYTAMWEFEYGQYSQY